MRISRYFFRLVFVWLVVLFGLQSVAIPGYSSNYLPIVQGAALTVTPAATVPAFPGAEGYGAASVGGRGGRVIEVTNLNDRGVGSLRKALEAEGPRIVVFRVGGTIALSQPLFITNPYVTIAGQTAPGDGIALRLQGFAGDGAALVIRTHDVVVRHMRFRPGPGGRPDAVSIISTAKYHAYNVILDHVSASWSVDKVIELASDHDNPKSFVTRDVTIQNSIISEGLHCSTYPNECHSKGLMIGAKVENVTVYRNLIAHNVGRSPLIHATGRVDLINNVIYYSGIRSYSESSEVQIANSRLPVGTPQHYNFIGNYHARHANIPPTEPSYDEYNYEILYMERKGDPVTDMRFYVADTLGPHRPDESIPQEEIVEPLTRRFLVGEPFAGPSMTISRASAAYESVLNEAGATFPKRDAVDARVVQDVRNRSGSPINHPSQVGGWPVLASGTPPVDTDHDGMPDAWESQQGLNPTDPGDGAQDADQDGYTNVEEYLNEIPLASALGMSSSQDSQVSESQVYLPHLCE